jgi:quercetin dioxygenase-like cupin family protein
MAIEFKPGHFTSRDEAVAEIAASGLFLAEADLEPGKLTGAAHVHPYRVEIYMLEGSFELDEPDTGRSYRLDPGSRTVVPADTLHAESSTARFHAVFGVSEDPAPIMAARAAEIAQSDAGGSP